MELQTVAIVFAMGYKIALKQRTNLYSQVTASIRLFRRSYSTSRGHQLSGVIAIDECHATTPSNQWLFLCTYDEKKTKLQAGLPRYVVIYSSHRDVCGLVFRIFPCFAGLMENFRGTHGNPPLESGLHAIAEIYMDPR